MRHVAAANLRLSTCHLLLGCLALALLGGWGGPVYANDGVEEESARVAREELVETARTQVSPQDPTAGGLEALREDTAKKRAELESALKAVGDAGADWLPASLRNNPLRRLDDLVGKIKIEPGVEGEAPTSTQTSTGLIASGAILYRWITGGLLPSEGPPARKEPLQEGESEEPQTMLPHFMLVDADSGAVILPGLSAVGPRVSDKVDAARRDALLRGTLKVQLLEDGTGEEALRFPATVQLRPWAYTEPESRHQHVLAWRGELTSPISAPYLAWRKLQADIRIAAMKLEAPTGLVNDAEVAAKKARVERIRDEVAKLEALRTTIDQALVRTLNNPETMRSEDRAAEVRELLPWGGQRSDLRRSEQKWVDLADQLDVEVERLDLVCKDCPESERTLNLQKYEVMRLLGRVVQQEQRLLYVTVLRAERRRHWAGLVLEAVKGELRVANEVYDNFEKRRDGARLKRQLINLRNARRDLAKDLADIAGFEPLSADTPDAPRSARYRRVEALIAYNEALEDLVTIRRDLELAADARDKVGPASRVPGSAQPTPADPASPSPSSPPADASEKDGATESDRAPAVNPAAGNGSTATEAVPGEIPAGDAEMATPPEVVAAAEPELPLDLLSPKTQFLDATYVAHAAEYLDDPQFDSGLVARHYEAVDRTINDLDTALAAVSHVDDRSALLTEKAVEIRQLLAPSPDGRQSFIHRRGDERKLERMQTTKEVTLVGIEKASTRLTTRRAVLADYRSQLRGLKLRSFRIREDRTLGADTLEEVVDDVASSGGGVWRWFTFRGERHIGTFVTSNWMAFLAWLALALGAFFVVRLGRHAIDRALTRMAAKVEALSDRPVSVKAEAEQVREQRLAQEAKRQAAEDGALAEARGESDRARPVSSAGDGGDE